MSSSEKIGCEEIVSTEYTKLEAKMAQREQEMQRQLGTNDCPY